MKLRFQTTSNSDHTQLNFCHMLLLNFLSWWEENSLYALSFTTDSHQLSYISIYAFTCELWTSSYCQHVCVLLLAHVMLQSNTLHLPSWDNKFTASLGYWALSLFKIESWSDWDNRYFVAHRYLVGLCLASLSIMISFSQSDIEVYSLGRIWVF